MVVCELDKEVSGAVLGFRLPAWQAVLVHKVLPSCGGLVIYMTLMCFDFALIYEHYENGAKGLGAFCLILTILPSILTLIFTLATPPPSLRTEDYKYTVHVQTNDCWWILMQIVNFIFFPIAAIGRYCHQIFWWVEAVCASYVDDKDRTKDAIRRAHEPSPLELYLFLQSFLHAAPHAIVNLLDLLTRSQTQTSFSKVSVQAVSIIASTLRMTSTATIYRRFQREKICGRKYPWQTIEEVEDNDANENIEKEQDQENQENIYETIPIKELPSPEPSTGNVNRYANSDLIQFSPRQSGNSPLFFDSDTDDSGSDYLQPVKNVEYDSGHDSDGDYVRPMSIIDRVAPRRRDTQYTIEEVKVTPPPAEPAPRPLSLAVWAEKFVENAEAIPSWLSAPQRSKYHREVVKDEPDLPRHVPRNYMRGLEPEDATAGLVHYLGWYTFFIARLMSIAAFINTHPVSAAVVLITHYQIMVLLLIVPKASSVKRSFYVFLGFIYLFCLMEFKVRFRHVRVWHVCWCAACTVQIIIFTALWASLNTDVNWWWRQYVVIVIMGSMLMSYTFFLFYFVILKPRETIVYNISKNKTDL